MLASTTWKWLRLRSSLLEYFDCEKPPEVPEIAFLTVDVVDFEDFGSYWSTIEEFVGWIEGSVSSIRPSLFSCIPDVELLLLHP